MRSTSGQHWIALDHVRALAAFMVFTWHFTHFSTGTPVPFEVVPSLFPFALLDEGHTGVALFMTLSGYIFAKLLDGKSVNYGAFLWNRFLRLVPLLTAVMLLVVLKTALSGGDVGAYPKQLLQGLVLPTLPNGGWSITVEAHFYLLLPLLLWCTAKWPAAPLVSVALALLLREWLLSYREIQSISYWTLIGHVDNFVMGIFAFRHRHWLKSRHALAVILFLLLAATYWFFDRSGGFYLQPDGYPSRTHWWAYLPVAESIGYGALIAYYDSSWQPSNRGISRLIGLLGAYSYSIYLLHFFVVFAAARLIHNHVMPISNFYIAVAWSAAVFCLMGPIGHLSYKFIEAPFLKLRRPYARRVD